MSKESRKSSNIELTNDSNLNSQKIKENKSSKNLYKSKIKLNLSDNNEKSLENKIKNDVELKEKLALDMNKLKKKSINEDNPKIGSKTNSISDLTSNLPSKRNEIKSLKIKDKKRKKKRKTKISSKSIEYSVEENLYLTEVNKKLEKKIESQNQKYLKNILEKLK